MNYLKMDKNMLYSLVNMKLRDFYSDLEDFCLSENIDIDEMKTKLEENELIYDRNQNKLLFK